LQKVLKFVLFLLVAAVLVWVYKYFEASNNKSLVSEDFAYGNGRIASTEVMVSPKISGRVEALYVQEGDIVEKGQKLAQLDTKELEAQLQLTCAQIKQAQENKNHALALLEQKKSERDLAHRNFQRAQTLRKKQAISELSYEQEETNYKSVSAAYKAAQASVAQANEAINVAKAQAAILQVTIDESTLYAPVKGRVLYKLAQDGEVVGGGQNLLVLLDLLDTYMSIYLPTSQAGKIDFGSEARIVLDALPDVVIPAKVTFVSPQAQFTPKQIETQDERAKLMFRVKVNIDTTLLEEHIHRVKTGLPGIVYIPMVADPLWPEALSKLPKSYKAHSSNMK
jgi:HlyD family secretion protein